jgi:hypothetical protein
MLAHSRRARRLGMASLHLGGVVAALCLVVLRRGCGLGQLLLPAVLALHRHHQ